MAEQLKISNGIITAVISTKGAELKSVVKDGTEILWDGNPDIWSGQAPLLFPICGGVKDDKYIFEGKEYTLEKHGFARKSEFQVERAEEAFATFILRSNEETKKRYPFDFELRVTYTLVDSKIDVAYSVKNVGNGNMYFSIGAHEGYACTGGVEEYSLIFDKEEDFACNILDGNLLEYNTYSVGEGRELPLKYDFFDIDALTFLNLKSRGVDLVHRPTGKSLRVEFEGFDYLFVWTKPKAYANYICIEPWCGIPDFVDSDFDITKKRGIVKLEANSEKVLTHSIIL